MDKKFLTTLKDFITYLWLITSYVFVLDSDDNSELFKWIALTSLCLSSVAFAYTPLGKRLYHVLYDEFK